MSTEPEYRYTYELNLAGGRRGDRQDVILLLKDGEPLELVREPENTHDPSAVAVYARGEQIGYVPAFKSEMTAEYLDHGKTVDAHVLAVEEYETDSGKEALGVRMFLGFSDEKRSEEQPSKAERMIARGDAMQKAGDSMSKTGNSMMGCGCAVFVLAVLALLAYLFFG